MILQVNLKGERKIWFVCNHCKAKTKWYKTALHEASFSIIDGKNYCDSCIKRFAEIFVREAEL